MKTFQFLVMAASLSLVGSVAKAELCTYTAKVTGDVRTHADIAKLQETAYIYAQSDCENDHGENCQRKDAHILSTDFSKDVAQYLVSADVRADQCAGTPTTTSPNQDGDGSGRQNPRSDGPAPSTRSAPSDESPDYYPHNSRSDGPRGPIPGDSDGRPNHPWK